MVDNSAETLVFINYRSKDAASAAALLYAEMSSRFGPEAVFLDYESIRLGHDYEAELLTRVRRSAVLLVIIGDRWLDGEPGERPIDDPADWVHREILQAMDHGVPVLPVLFPGATLDAARLPPALAALANYQYFQVRRRQRSDITALGDHLLRQLPRLAEHQARRTTVPADGRRPVALTGLPPAARTFVGREVELRRLSAVLHGDEPGECAVIAGLAGVGKTALALVAAHRALRAGWFPGGALMIDMRGYDALDRRVRPEAALGGILTDLGIPAEHVPLDSAARVRLWRTILAERGVRGLRTLIIVDNAFASEQVRPLLPAVAGHRVLVTSRHTLTDLDAVVTRLDVLDPGDAGQLVREHLTAADPDDDRARQHDTDVEQVARLCGGLPLAIRIAGALLAADRGQSVAEMVETLTDECCRLEELSYDGSLAVRSAFDLSYRHLDDPDARLFRLLAVHPGPEFSAALADVVAGGTSRGNLRRLHRANLVEASRERGRWRMHDLVRLYAQQLARSDPERGAVVGRIVEHYIALCGQARPGTDPLVLDALRELDRELFTVVALVNRAHETELDDRVIRLAEAMSTYFDLRKCWDAWILIDRVALRSAHRVRDECAAGRIRLNLGVAYRDLGRFDDALGCFDRALVQFRRNEDGNREAEALNGRAVVLRKCGRFDESLVDLASALAVWHQLGDALGQARALNNTGLVHLNAGVYDEAVVCFQRALAKVHETSDERRTAKVLHNYGVVCLRQGRLAESARWLTSAISLRHDLGDRYREAKSRTVRGSVLLRTGRPREAADDLRRALAVFGEVGDQRWARRAQAHLGQTC